MISRKALEQSLSGERVSHRFRAFPGIDEYLAALDEAVEERDNPAKSGRRRRSSKRRQSGTQITDRLGRDKQRPAYLKHLGITEP